MSTIKRNKRVQVPVEKVKAVKVGKQTKLLTIGEDGITGFVGSQPNFRGLGLQYYMQIGNHPIYTQNGNDRINRQKITEIHTYDEEEIK